ncbi:hypothetical protein BWR19_08470 [Halomonas sp. 1513]|nr:TRAP transporter small permease subunit [Halomonas sp. 1513]APX92961.1 hypothetical protein BWR19_08470 [Halomonas sp. 1513]
MRAILNAIYRITGGLAAFFLAAIGASVIVQVVGRQLGYTVDATEFAGFCLAASTFLALAYSFRHGSHVRVTLLVDSLPPGAKRIIEIWVCICALAVLSWLSWNAIQYTWQAYKFGDVSPGLLSISLWIPQTGMVAGLVVMGVAVLDDLVNLLRNGKAEYFSN